MNNGAVELNNLVAPAKCLRILNGVLRGCEFTIESSRALIVTSSSLPNESLTIVDDLPEDTIFLPVNEESLNFEVLFDDTNKYVIRELNEKGAYEKDATFNTLSKVDGLHFSIKKQGDEWSREILSLKEKDKSKKNAFLSPLRKHYMVVYVLVTALMLGVITFSIGVYNSESNYMRRLSQILANRDLLFSEGYDHILYVIAQDHRKAIWANQVVERGDFSTTRVKIISPENEIKRINFWLADNYPNLQYFRIQLGRSLIPILLISKQRNILSEDEKEQLRKRLMNFLPYAKYLSIQEVDDYQLVKEAEQGLQSLGLTYGFKKNGNHYSYHLEGEFDDSQLVKLKYFINEFYRKWGTEFIIFNVMLSNDKFKRNSYSIGDVNFVKKSPLQWDFDVKNINEN